MNTETGRMEEDASVSKVLRELADLYDKGKGFVISGSKLMEMLNTHRALCQCSNNGWATTRQQEVCIKEHRGGIEHYQFVPGLVVSFIPASKHHNGKPMLFIGNHSDISTICLEISEEGLFAYYVDDGVS